jgi:hypothetical protein
LNVDVYESGIAGLGVFAKRAFRRGNRVLELDDSRVVDHVHPLENTDSPHHRGYLANGRVVLMQFPERYINHSCDPNVYVAQSRENESSLRYATSQPERRLHTTTASMQEVIRCGPATAARGDAATPYTRISSTYPLHCRLNTSRF